MVKPETLVLLVYCLVLTHTPCLSRGPQVKTLGQPWPMPQTYTPTNATFVLDGGAFQFTPTGPLGVECDLLFSAFERYYNVLFDGYYWESMERWNGKWSSGNNTVSSLNVTVKGTCEKYPYLNMDESYELLVEWPSAVLTAATVWGALRGLETFSQLSYESPNGQLFINGTTIKDAPRFSHRGSMLDTSRHFLPLESLFKHLDAMAYNKVNVFHWHIVDDQSFPYQSTTFPKLNQLGAYNAYTHTYSQDDVYRVIEYARLRGIRVLPEFDTPGHTQSWGKGQPDLLTECYSKDKPNGAHGPIDPSVNSSFVFLRQFMTEVVGVFPDKYVHVGGDEVSFDCWKSNPNIQKFMKAMGFNDSYNKLENYYEQTLLDILNSLDHGYVVWQEIMDNGIKVRSDTVVEIWKMQNWQKEVNESTKLGLRTLLAAPWYLNSISYGEDWTKYYNIEPADFNGTEQQRKLLIGGEMCTWGEWVDATNVISRTWPRGSAPAERLWSPENVKMSDNVAARLEEHRCRMIRRGLNVEPVIGPGFCKHEYRPGTWRKFN